MLFFSFLGIVSLILLSFLSLSRTYAIVVVVVVLVVLVAVVVVVVLCVVITEVALLQSDDACLAAQPPARTLSRPSSAGSASAWSTAVPDSV